MFEPLSLAPSASMGNSYSAEWTQQRTLWNTYYYHKHGYSQWCSFCRLKHSCASACKTNTTQNQPHQISNTQRTENKTTDVVIQQHSRKLLMMDLLMSETYWAHKQWNKTASDIKLVFHSSTITTMHGPINITFTISLTNVYRLDIKCLLRHLKC